MEINIEKCLHDNVTYPVRDGHCLKHQLMLPLLDKLAGVASGATSDRGLVRGLRSLLSDDALTELVDLIHEIVRSAEYGVLDHDEKLKLLKPGFSQGG